MEREHIPPATCSICGGTEIIYAESELNIVKPYLVTPRNKAQDHPGKANIDYMKMEMNVLVCTDCGHSVFYAKEPHKLKHKREAVNS